jgi:hypothetical protein
MTDTFKIDIINNVVRARTITQWCSDNLNNAEWDLKLLSMRPLHYTVEFINPHTQLLCVLSH